MTLPCPAEYWPLFSTLLDEALDLPQTKHETWLAALDGDRAILRPWLARVLTGFGDPPTGRFLNVPRMLANATFDAEGTVGPFRLVRKLGEGGMGEVWLADRAEDGPQRQVALKLPHAFLLGTAARMRFQHERDIVAALTHPNIAQLYEAGVSSNYVPYLALEYVDGTPISVWCNEKSLSLDERLALVQEILDALGYAHRRLIVHRDIKPSNILVTAEGRLKLLDFGIAKLLGNAAETGEMTQPLARLATPEYAAPEQLQGEPVTVSTDLFAVGAVMFELVTGVRPFTTPKRSPDQSAPLASTRADPNLCRTPLGARLAKALRGDLDAILAKALELDPAWRYPSADSFASDIARFRAGQIVSARRVGWLTRTAKFLRRQRLASSLAAACVLAVVAGVVGIGWQATRAEHEATRANLVKDFLISVFQSSDPRARHDKPPGDVTAKELLDSASERLDSGFAGDPESELDVMATLSDIYEFMEDAPRAERIEARRVALARKLYGPNSPVVLQAMLDQAWGDAGFDDYGKAKTLLAEIRDKIPVVYGAQSHQRGVWLMEQALALVATPGARGERQRNAREAAAIFASETPKPDDYPTVQDLLGHVEMDSGRFAEALKTFDAAAAADRADGGFDPVEEMIYDIYSAEALQNLGRPDEAERRYRAVATAVEHTLGRHSTVYFQAVVRLADLLHQRGKRAEADRIFQRAASDADRSDTPPGEAMFVKETYGVALVAEGHSADAQPELRAALALANVRPHDVHDLPRIQQALGEAEDQLGHRAEAEPLLAAARARWMREGPASAPWVLGARERWARFEMADRTEVAVAADECRAIVKDAGRLPSAPVALAQADLAQLALIHGDITAARDESAAALNTMNAVTGLYDVGSWILVWRARALALAAEGDAAGAKIWTERARDAVRRYGPA